jgi:SAM-dependent methyltransferase
MEPMLLLFMTRRIPIFETSLARAPRLSIGGRIAMLFLADMTRPGRTVARAHDAILWRMPTRENARAQLSALYASAPRDVYFDAARASIAEYYLADPSNPYQQSGSSSGAERWKETRYCIVDAIHRSGDFLDVGCANGLLLADLISWAAERGLTLRPHGIDFVPELIALTRRRFPGQDGSFEAANAFYWTPRRQYDFVRTNLEYIQPPDWPQYIARYYSAVAPGGRLILSQYRNESDARVDIPALLTSLGYFVVGSAEVSGKSFAWCERRDESLSS